MFSFTITNACKAFVNQIVKCSRRLVKFSLCAPQDVVSLHGALNYWCVSALLMGRLELCMPTNWSSRSVLHSGEVSLQEQSLPAAKCG